MIQQVACIPSAAVTRLGSEYQMVVVIDPLKKANIKTHLAIFLLCPVPQVVKLPRDSCQVNL